MKPRRFSIWRMARGLKDSADRHTAIYAFLLFMSVTLDVNVYVLNVAHVYVHDLASVAAGILGLRIAVSRRTLIPAERRLLVPLVFMLFVIVNTILLGVVAYPSVPPDMRRLFWYEHGDAIRIVAELFTWIWTLGVLAPASRSVDRLLDVADWGCLAAVAIVGLPWYFADARPQGTTPVDLYVLVGCPLATYFVLVRTGRLDRLRLFAFGLATTLVYSRTTMVAVAVALAVAVIALWRPRQTVWAVSSLVAAWILIFVPAPAADLVTRAMSSAGRQATSYEASMSPEPVLAIATPTPATPLIEVAGGSTARERAASIVNPQIAPYTIPSRIKIWADALRIAWISPVVGVGYHNYFLQSRVIELKTGSELDPPELFSSLIKQAHNDFLSWLIEAGIVGLTFYLFCWVFLVLELLKPIRQSKRPRDQHSIGLALALGILAVSTVGEILIPRAPSWNSAAIVWWLVMTGPLIAAKPRGFDN